ncbi:MAG: hypothetical protein QG671_2039 [Actinomycetota bacterium]|nr:hypothetical protein [Actinomycetota bacterium]
MTSAERVKYPRTPHLPSSPGAAADDVVLAAGDLLAGRQIVLTEKMDGENTTIGTLAGPDGQHGYVHARSTDSGPHPSRSWVRALASTLHPELPAGMRICGENLYARHSIGYDDLPTYFLVFGVWQNDACLSWDDTVEWCALLGLTLVPVLYRGPFVSEAHLLDVWRDRRDPRTSEGFVVRDAAAFPRVEFAVRVGKWVRPGHVQTGQHWMTTAVVPNGLAPSSSPTRSSGVSWPVTWLGCGRGG